MLNKCHPPLSALLLLFAMASSAYSQEPVIQTPQIPAAPVKAMVKPFNGTPTLFINDKPQPIFICREHQPWEEAKHSYIQKATKGGVDIVWDTVNPLTIANKNSYESVDREFAAILKDIPDAYIMLQFSTDIKPRWDGKWCKKHPEEMMVWPPDMRVGDRASTASKIWKEAQKKALRDLIAYIRKSPYADRVIGGVICGGNGEWLDWWDYSKPARAAFRDWLRDKYGNDVSALRKAWNDDSVNFDDVSLPAWKSLFTADMGLFWDPAKSQRKIDFMYYHHELTANVIAEFAAVIKDASDREMVVGVWNGSFFLMPGAGGGNGEGGMQRRRHGAYCKLVRNPDIDFFHTPYAYRERGPGGVYMPQLLVDSIFMHGKIAIPEDDTRTLLTNPHHKYQLAEQVGDNFGKAKDMPETISLLKRNFAGIFSKPGSGVTWFSLGLGLWFDHPEIIKTFSVFREIADGNLGKDRRTSQIAVIVSNKSLFYQRINSSSGLLLSPPVVEGLCRIGAPFDIYEDIDLTDGKFPYANYKFYVFLNTFHFSAKEREAIAKNIKANGNTVLWIYAPGFVGEDGLSAKSVSELVGMEMDYVDPKYEFGADVVLTDYSSPVTKGLPTNLRYGTEFADSKSLPGPVFICDDKSVDVLGMMMTAAPGIGSISHPGLCMKKSGAWTSIWSAAPNPPSNLLRNMAKYAGVHIYDDGDDQVLASKMLLAINGRYAGKRTIVLPEKCSVYDPFKKEYLGKNIDRVECYIDAADTKIWTLEPDSDVKR